MRVCQETRPIRVVLRQVREVPSSHQRITFHLSENDLPAMTLKDGSTHSFPYDEDLVVEKKSKKNTRNLITGLKPLKEYAALLQANAVVIENGEAIQHNALPQYAYYTTEDIHIVRKFDKEKKTIRNIPKSRLSVILKVLTPRGCSTAG